MDTGDVKVVDIKSTKDENISTIFVKRKLGEVTSPFIKKLKFENKLEDEFVGRSSIMNSIESEDAAFNDILDPQYDIVPQENISNMNISRMSHQDSPLPLKTRVQFFQDHTEKCERGKDVHNDNSTTDSKRTETWWKTKLNFPKPNIYSPCTKDVSTYRSEVNSELSEGKDDNNKIEKSTKSSNGIRKFVNLAILESRYVFINKIQGTPFYYCFDIKEKEHYYCKVSVKPCTDILEAYNRLKDNNRINPLRNVTSAKEKTYLLFPRPQGDLLTYLRQRKVLPEMEAKLLFRQICEIVFACHSKGIVLRDVKLGKFVFTDEDRKHVKLESLIDVVVLKDPENDLIHEKLGCLLYVAPEIISSNEHYHGKAADMWSLGVILYLMLVGRYPFNDPCLYLKIGNRSFKVPENISPKARCLIYSLLQKGPSKRITAEDIFYHPWMTTTDDNTSYELTNTEQCVPIIDVA